MLVQLLPLLNSLAKDYLDNRRHNGDAAVLEPSFSEHGYFELLDPLVKGLVVIRIKKGAFLGVLLASSFASTIILLTIRGIGAPLEIFSFIEFVFLKLEKGTLSPAALGGALLCITCRFRYNSEGQVAQRMSTVCPSRILM